MNFILLNQEPVRTREGVVKNPKTCAHTLWTPLNEIVAERIRLDTATGESFALFILPLLPDSDTLPQLLLRVIRTNCNKHGNNTGYTQPLQY